MISWFAPGGTFRDLEQWREGSTTIRRREWPSQAEQVLYLRAVIGVYRGTETIRRCAVRIVFDLHGCAPKDKPAQALAVGNWVQDRITYVEERPERFITPIRLLAQPHPAADCDDFAALIGSLCESIGIAVRLCAASWRGPSGATGYRHIWPEAATPIGWIPLDATLRGPVGRTSPRAVLAAQHPDAKILIL